MCDHQQRTTNNEQRTIGFTLIELLVVIAIIAILASILLPAMNAAFRKAEKTQAVTEIKSIETAVKAFYSDYGKFPAGNGNAGDYSYGGVGPSANNSQLMNVLRGIDSTNNPRKTVYIEIAQDSLSTNNFIDPWGQQYEVTIDTGFDGKCNDLKGGYPDVTNKVVVIWSRGPNGVVNPPPNNDDDLRSWEL